MKLKIGVMGSASGKLSVTHKKIAYGLGCAITFLAALDFSAELRFFAAS